MIKHLKRIIRRMARFRDMRKFVRFIKDEHLATIQHAGGARFPHNESWDFEWPCTDVAREKYAKQESTTANEAADIIDDCVAFGYLRYSEMRQPRHDHTLIITPKGRHLLMKLGLIREIAKDNSEWINLVVAFLIGALTVGLTAAYTIWVADHTKPPYVNVKPPDVKVNNYIQPNSKK